MENDIFLVWGVSVFRGELAAFRSREGTVIFNKIRRTCEISVINPPNTTWMFQEVSKWLVNGL